MSEAIGRAGFNVRHLRHGESGTRADRASILRESMRELDSKAAGYYAAHNPNIVPQDTRLNVAMVNDGAHGFRPAKSTSEVLAYGDTRIGTQQNPNAEDRVSNTGRKWNPRSFETTLIVVSLPRSMCVEVAGVYPVTDAHGVPVLDADGAAVTRSRWVARDRDEALHYFAETAGFLASEVLTGGTDSIHGYDVNFDEAYPHMQLMADTLAPSPKKSDGLRVEAQQMWGISGEVRNPATGKVEQPKAKMTRYQQSYRAHMHGLGYEVELQASERSTSSHTREEWAVLQERERIAQADLAGAAQVEQQNLADAQRIVEARKFHAARTANLDQRERAVAAGEGELPKLLAHAGTQVEIAKKVTAAADVAAAAKLAAADAETARMLDATQITVRRLREDAEAELETANKIKQIGYGVLAKIDAEYERVQKLPTIMVAFLDAPLKSGGTLRSLFERFASTFQQQKAFGQRLRTDLNEWSPGARAPKSDDDLSMS